MKKIAIALLEVLLCISMAACAPKEEKQAENDIHEEETTADNENTDITAESDNAEETADEPENTGNEPTENGENNDEPAEFMFCVEYDACSPDYMNNKEFTGILCIGGEQIRSDSSEDVRATADYIGENFAFAHLDEIDAFFMENKDAGVEAEIARRSHPTADVSEWFPDTVPVQYNGETHQLSISRAELWTHTNSVIDPFECYTSELKQFPDGLFDGAYVYAFSANIHLIGTMD